MFIEAKDNYNKARKMGQKSYRAALVKGEYPYLQVLDDILKHSSSTTEVDLGLVEIPLDQIVGTKTAGRTQAFANNFMPLLADTSEFGAKWIKLFYSHEKDGIREPIKACEFMNRFYVIEGNKRVSVLKYSGAMSVPGYVTRYIPAKSDDKEVKLYYEFLDFYKLTNFNDLWFSEEGSYAKLLKVLGMSPDHVWTTDERKDFHSCFDHFSNIFVEKGGKELMLTYADAFLVYLNVYGYNDFWDKPYRQISQELDRIWNDFKFYPNKPSLELVMNPQKDTSIPVINRILPANNSVLKIAFIHDKNKEISSWTYGHELGRQHINQVFDERVQTVCYDNVDSEELCLKTIDDAIADGCTVIFTTTPRLLGASVKAAIQYPDIKILNCSLNTYTGHLRTYYGRLYEAKFLSGALSGILTDTDNIGYLADYPIYGMIANINAFALGVKMTNPKATVHLEWSTVKGSNPEGSFRDKNVSYISGQDLITPQVGSRKFGLYDIRGNQMVNIALSIWHWGKFYERIINNILTGSWKKEEPGKERKAINYWWGLSSGMIDIIISNNVPEKTRWMIDLLKREMAENYFNPFSGDLFDQNGIQRNLGNGSLTPEQIINMDWLLDNVNGKIPAFEDLIDEAKPTVLMQGVNAPANF